jgi:hypothetical protein
VQVADFTNSIRQKIKLIDNTTIYYFSKKVLLEAFVWFGILGIVVVLIFVSRLPIYYDFILIPCGLLFLLIQIPNSLRKIYYLYSNRPALVIGNEFLIDNFNFQKYNWADIFEITYNERKKAICINIGDKNIEKYTENDRWFLAKWVTKTDLRIYHGTFFISNQFIDIKNTAFMNIVHFHSLAQTTPTKLSHADT